LATQKEKRGHLLSGTTPRRGYTLGSDNGALSVSAYSGIPFRPAAPGSIHSTRCRRLTPYPALWDPLVDLL